MRNCAFLTMDSLDGYVSDDHLLHEPLEALGWKVSYVSWRKRGVDWNAFDAVIIRTPWDYHNDPQEFLRVLAKIDASSARLENSLELVRWNIEKTYLLDLATRGIEIVPTKFMQGFDVRQMMDFGREFRSEELVVKPVVSASAENTFRLGPGSRGQLLDEASAALKGRHVMVQPFMKGIVEEGEYSVFFFGDVYSHTILKTPKEKDFRVQEEHGGIITAVTPSAELVASADHVLSAITSRPLYSRIDVVRTLDGHFAVMELELIEPALYFRMDPESPARFASVFDQWMSNNAKVERPSPLSPNY